MGSLRSWLARVAAWLAEAKLLWLAAGVVLASLLAIDRLGATEPVIRVSGLGLQLLGIGTVAWGIGATWRLFGHPTLLSRTAAWLRRFPPYKRRLVLAVDAGDYAIVGAKGRAHVVRIPAPNATLEERVASLEANLGYLDGRIAAVVRELDAASDAQTTALRREGQERVDAETLIKQRLEALGTGGLDISAIGVLWLFVGVILSAAAPELAEWLR